MPLLMNDGFSGSQNHIRIEQGQMLGGYGESIVQPLRKPFSYAGKLMASIDYVQGHLGHGWNHRIWMPMAAMGSNPPSLTLHKAPRSS